MEQKTILIVDDDAAMCDSLADILRESGYVPFTAKTVAEGERIARERLPRVALLDLKLPDGTGTGLLARLKTIDPDIACIIITAHADVDSAINALERGAIHYVQKPVRPPDLLQLIEQIFVSLRLRDEKRLTEAALKESEGKYRSLVENLNVGVFRVSAEPFGRFIQANRAMAKLIGYPSIEELMSITLDEHCPDRQACVGCLRDAIVKGPIRDREIMLRRKDGSPRWVSFNLTAHFDESGAVLWIDGVVEDVTDRRRLEEHLRHAQKMEAIGTLAGGVAHDFNNILTAIIGYANLLKLKVGPDFSQAGYLEQILASAERASKLTHGLLAFSKRQAISARPVNLNEIVGRIERLLTRVIGEDIELHTVLGHEDLTIMADAAQIEQVLINLAANSRDAMPDGGLLSIVTDCVPSDVRTFRSTGDPDVALYARLAVSDTGQGMDEQTRQRIFEPFFTTKETGKGTGLGLAIAYGIVKQHDGFINVYSEPGKGTTFTIYLPLAREASGEAEEQAGKISRGGTETILLVEDEQDVRDMEQHMLEEFGYTVIEASDGEDAVARFRQHHDSIDLVVMDVIMPKMNGKEAYERMREIKPGLKALFMSGYSGDILSRRGVVEEGLTFIAKPASPRDFLAKIRAILDSAK